MLSSSCAAALLAGTGGHAAAQDAPRLWGAWGELGAQAGAETNAFLEGFMPLGQDADSIVFLDMRLDYGQNSRGSTSIGLGLREIVGPDLILGANVFVDAVRTENGNTFAGATLGLEAFTSIFDLRVNAHVPIGGGTTLSPIVTGDGVSIVNNQLVENRTRTDRKEGLLYGLTGEIGAMFDSPFADNQRLRAYAGGYVYDRGGYDTQAGGRLGLEYQINDVLSLAGSRFTLGAELVYDKDDEFDAIASARLRIPLFAGAQSRDANGESRLSAIQQRMDEGVRRDKGIRVGTESSTTAVNGVPVINPATGNPFGGVYYADQAGGGTGSFADPTSLATAVANAGTDGIVIALGGGGPITTSGITLQSGQTLIGGGESIQVQLADGSTTNFLLSGTNGTIDGDPGVTTVTLASGVTIRDLTIQGGTTVIGGNAVSNFTLTDLNIQNATDGISVTGAAGANVSNISFSGITGTSLFLNNQSATISNITINGGTNGLSIANNTGTTTLSNINVSNVSGDALSFSNNTGVINVSGFTATNTGDDAIAVTGGGTFGFTGTTTLSGLGAGATSDGIDLSNTNNATLTFGDVDVTGLGGGTGLNMAGADATLTMQSLDITGTGVAGSKGVDLSGTQNGRTVSITNGGTITNVDVGLVLGTNGGALAAPDAVFTWGGGDIGGLTYALDGIGVNAANGSYAFGTTGFSGAFNFTTSGTPNYFIAASATGTGDGSSTANRASIATAIGAAAGLGTVNFVLINDGSAIDTSGLTFALADNQTIDTFGNGRTFTSVGLNVAANITGTNLPAGTTAITDPTGNGAATLTNTSGAVSTIEVANGNSIRNITLGSTLGTALSGTGIAGLTIEGVTIGSGTDTPVNGIELNNTTGAVTLTNVDITNTTGTGLSLNGAGGTVTGNNVDITGSNALSVNGGDAVVSFNATSSITNTSGTAVSITNRIGGSFTHFGSISSNGGTASGITISGATAASNVTFGGQVSLGTTSALGGSGVFINNNGQASDIAFTGGLEIETGGAPGFDVRNGGSISVAAAGTRTIWTGGATAFFLQNTSIGSDGLNFDSIESVGSGPFSGIDVSSVDTSAGGISIGSATLSGSLSRAIDLENVTGANGFSLTAADIDLGIGGTGVFIGGANGTISIGTGTANGITGLKIDDGDQGVRIDQTSGTVNLGTTSTGVVEIGTTAQLNIVALQVGTNAGGTINIGNTTNQSRFDAAFNAVASYDADATTTFTNISAESQTSTAVVVVDNDGVGETRFENGLAISTTGGTGLSIQSARVSVASAPGLNTLNVTGNGVGMILNNATIGTAGLHFDTVNIATQSIGISIAGTTGGGDIVFGDVDINGTNTGTQAIRIAGTASNNITIADFDTNLLQGQTALQIDGSYSGTMTFGDFDVTSSSTTGTTGIDLSNATGGGTVQVGDTAAAGASASISGVDTGVLLGNGTNLGFVYGDGEGAIDQGSTISATTAIGATNAPVAGTYNFQDVNFAGSPGAGFGIGAIYFVDSDGATGGGDGSGSSAANPMTLAAAEAAAGAGDIIVLIDNGSAITAAGTNANNTLDLAASQQLLSFGDGAGGSQAIQVSLTVPPTIQLFAAGLTIADPTGNGAATLTTSAGNNVVTLGGDGIRVSGIDFQGNGTAARAINDAGGATGTVIERSSVSNFANVGIEITPSTNTTINTVTFSGNNRDILLNAANSTLTNITSTGVTGTSITLNNATGTTTLSNISITGAGAGGGVSFNNASGTVTATNVDISGRDTLAIDGGDAVFSFDAASSINATGGTAVSISNRSGGSFTHAGSVVANGAGTAGIFSFASTGAHSISFTGTVDIGTTTAITSSGVFIDNTGQNVTINFADIDIETDTGFGMVVQNGGTLSVGTGSLAVNNAQITNFAGIAFGAGGVNFTSITGTNLASAAGLGFNTVTGGAFTVSGTTSIAGSTGSAIAATNVSANMQFGTVDLTLTSGDGLLLAGNAGTLTTGDMTIAMGTGGNGIRATGTNGTMTFGNVDITNVGTGTGVNLSGGTFDGQVTFATLDITGTSQTGSKGINLTGYDNSKDVVTTGSGTIQGVQTGIDLTNSDIANGVRFQYGDGSAPVASSIDTSGIAGNVAIVTTGVTATGEYDFEDIGFGTSNVSNLTGPVVFVVDQNNSSGAGTFSDPGSISEAAAATADVIVLIDTDTGTGTQTVSMAGPLSLDNGQVLIGLDSGTTSIDVSTLGIAASGPPASVLLTGLGSSSTITSTVTLDSNRLVLNSSSGNTVNLTGSAGIQNVAITNTGTGDGISASFSTAESVTIRSSSIGGGTGGYAIDLATTSGASTYAFSDLALTSGLRLDGSGGGSLSGTMTGANTIDGASGTGLQITNASGTFSNITFGANSAIGGAGIQIANSDATSRTVALSSITMGSGGAGDTGDVGGIGVDINSSGSGVLTVNLTGTNFIRSTGQALDADETNGALNRLLLSIDNTTFESNAAGVPTVEITGQNVSTTTSSVGVRSFSGNAVRGNGTGGGILFTAVDFDGDGAGTAVSAGTLNIGQLANFVQGDGLSLIDTTGELTLGTLSIYNNGGTGLEVDTKTNGFNTDFTLNGGGSGTILTTNGAALWLDPLTMNLSFGSVTSTNSGGNGVFIDGGNATAAGNNALTVTTLSVTGSTSAGLRITNSTGTFNFGATTVNNAGSAGGGVDLDLGTGDTATVNFTGALDIDTNAATGFDANGTGGTLLTVNVASAGTQAINSATGGLISFNQVAVGASGISFDNLGSSGKISGNAVTMTSVGGSGTFSGGNMNIAGASGNGIDIASSSGAFSFGSVIIGNTTTTDDVATGIRLNGNSGSFTLTGSSIINNPTGSGVAITDSGPSYVADFQAQIEVRNRSTASASAGDGFVLTNNGTATINFASLVYNDDQRSSAPTGQGLIVNDGGILTISDGTIRTNNALGDDVYTVDISNTTLGAGGVTIGSVHIQHYDAGESGGGLRLVNNSGTFSFTEVVGISTINGSAILANNTGTLNVGTTTAGAMSSNNRAVLDITSTTLNLNATATYSENSTGFGMTFNNVGGTVNLTGNMTITNSSNTGLSVANSTAGAAFAFSGGTKTINTGGLTAVSLTGNTGSTINFTGGGLDIDTTSGPGFVATGGGTVTVQGTGNSVTTTTGRAVQIDGTNIGAAGVTFQSISTNGASNAINLRNTGSSGFFAVTGVGVTNGSGGTIQNITGADMFDETPEASGRGAAIYLENATDVRLANIQVQNTSNFGLRGFGVNRMSLINVDFTGTHGDNAGPDEGVFYVNDLTGTVGISGGTFRGGIEDSIYIDNDGISGTLNLTITGATITTGDGANAARGNNGITIIADGGTVNGSIHTNTFTAAVASHIQLVSEGTANFGLTIDNNTFTKHSGIVGNGGIGVLAGTQSSGTFNVTISNNNMSALGSLNNAIDVGSVNGLGTFSGTVDMTISGNTIGTIGSLGSGTAFTAISVDADGGGSSVYRITGNIIYDHDRNGINVIASEGIGSSHQVSVLIQNNTITDNLSSGFFERGIQIDSGVQSGATPTVCATISGNEVTANGNYVDGIRVRARNDGSLQINNGVGGAATEVAIENYLSANNTVGNTIDAIISTTGTVTFVASCPN